MSEDIWRAETAPDSTSAHGEFRREYANISCTPEGARMLGDNAL
jgi:hypothetical protein